jgi:integrase
VVIGSQTLVKGDGRANQNGKFGRFRATASPPGASFESLAFTRTPYGKDTDFVFPSFKANGGVPLSPAVFVTDHLRKAAIGAGVQVSYGHRFGLHHLRRSLSNGMVNKAKVEPKTVQGILRHSRIQTLLNLYTQQDSDQARAAQGQFLVALQARAAVCVDFFGCKGRKF